MALKGPAVAAPRPKAMPAAAGAAAAHRGGGPLPASSGRLPPRARRLVVVVHDIVAAYLSFPIAVLLRQGEYHLPTPGMAAAMLWLPFFLLIFAAWQRMHRGVWRFASVRDLVTVVKVASLSLGAFYLVLYLTRHSAGIPRSLPIIHWFALVSALAGSRLAYAAWAVAGTGRRRLHILDWEPVLLAGAGPSAAMLAQLLRPGAACACEAVGIIDDRAEYQGRAIAGIPVLGNTAELGTVIARLTVHGMRPRRIVLARSPGELEPETLEAICAAASRHGLPVQEAVDLLRLREEFPPSRSQDQPATAATLLERRAGAALKRGLDLLVATLLLVLSAPLMAAIALLILLADGPPVLFHQIRPGRHLHPFTLYKFRTLQDGHLPDGRILPDEERQTGLSRFLRRTRLDELPQLWNVLAGNMSLIGPRPLLPRDLPDLGDSVHERFLVRPGITGWAQINGGHLLRPEEKLALDLWYIRNRSLRLDLAILMGTVKTMIAGDSVRPEALARIGAARRAERAW